MFVLTPSEKSTDVESQHLLARFHREFGNHATQHFLPLIRVHRRQTADELVARFHFAYLLAPIPIASNAEMVQTVMSVAVTG